MQENRINSIVILRLIIKTYYQHNKIMFDKFSYSNQSER
jgi:hypothetical protein